MIFYGVDFIVGQGAEELDKHVLVGANLADGIFDFFAVKVENWCAQSDQEILKVSTSFWLDVLDQILAKMELKVLGDLLKRYVVDSKCMLEIFQTRFQKNVL